MNRLVLNLSFLFTLTSFGVSGYSNFLPNNFELQEPLEDGSNIDEETFNSIIDKALQHYEPIIREHGAKLVINRLWTTDTVNASAMQNGKTWFVNSQPIPPGHPPCIRWNSYSYQVIRIWTKGWLFIGLLRSVLDPTHPSVCAQPSMAHVSSLYHADRFL